MYPIESQVHKHKIDSKMKENNKYDDGSFYYYFYNENKMSEWKK